MSLTNCFEWIQTQAATIDPPIAVIFGFDDPVMATDILGVLQINKVGESFKEYFDFNRRVHSVEVNIFVENSGGAIAIESNFETITGYLLNWVYQSPTLGGNCVVATPTGMVNVEVEDNSPLQVRVLQLDITTNLNEV